MSVAKQFYQLQEVDLELGASEQVLAQIEDQLGDSPSLLAARDEFARVYLEGTSEICSS